VAVDPHANEYTKEINEERYRHLKEIREAIAIAQAQEKILVEQIKDEMGSATAATVNGVKVLTYRPKQGWATKDLIRDYPELTEHYMTMEVVRKLDVYQFAAHHADIAAKYQTREFREAAQ
jgi:uncharacterized protein (DUF433 family)